MANGPLFFSRDAGFVRPSPLLAPKNCSGRLSCFGGPIGPGLGFPSIRNEDTVSAVSLLFAAGGPAAVAWFVVPVVVNSLYGVIFGWSFSHICEKILKRICPTVANSDSPACVFGQGSASAFHVFPSVILGRIFHSVFGHTPGGTGPNQASTRLSVARPDVCSIYRGCFPAITQAQPFGNPACRRSFSPENVKAAAILPGHVDDGPRFHGFPLLIGV